MKNKSIIVVYEDLIIQLENYKYENNYARTKISIRINFSELLLEDRHINKDYSYTFDSILLDSLNKIIDENIDNKIHDEYYVALAGLKKAIILKDRELFYLSMCLLNSSGCSAINNELIQSYSKMYNIYF